MSMHTGPRPTIRLLALLLGLAALVTAGNQIWIRTNVAHVPPGWDQAFYMYLSLSELELVKAGDVGGLLDFMRTQAPWSGPLVPLATVPFLLGFGATINSTYLVNFPFLFILLAAATVLARRLAGAGAGALTAFFCLTFPAFIAFGRDYLFELPLAALTALTMLLVLETESFRRRGVAVAAGISMGLMVLAKTMGLAFTAVPIAWATITFIRTKQGPARRNVLLFLLSFVAIASLYYAWNARAIFGYLAHFGFGAGAEPWTPVASLLAPRAWTIYLLRIARRGISLGFAALFVIILAAASSKGGRRPTRDDLLLWAWFVAGYIILSLVPNKGGERYALPILAPLAVLMATHLTCVRQKLLRRCLLGAAIAVGLSNLAYQSLSRRCQYEPREILGIPLLEPVHHTYYFQLFAGASFERSWNPAVLLQALDALAPPSRREIIVMVGARHYFLNPATIQLYAELGALGGWLRHRVQVTTASFVGADEELVKNLMAQSDFIVTRTSDPGPGAENESTRMLQAMLASEAPLASFEMTDGASARIYGGGPAAAGGS
ncbi:MAG: hypothetical protein V1750_04705 [Acidobacteriota bacterium]